jgi:HTH-type transcriptional regulator/antitoxin HigA
MTTVNRAAQVFPPGDFLNEELEERGWSQSDFADIIDRPEALVSRIINGKTAITPETAQSLSEALGTSAEFWLRLEAMYQLSKVPTRKDTIARRARLYAEAPVRELVNRRWIEGAADIALLESRIREFMALADDLPYAARKSTPYAEVRPAQRAWLCRARQLAPAVPIGKKYDQSLINELLASLRALMMNPEDTRLVPRLLGDFGIRIIIIQPLSGGRIDGATFWLDANSPVIALALRYDRIDHFWYTLLHELAHVYNGDGLVLDEDLFGKVESKPESEQRADDMAAEAVVSQRELDDFISRTRPLYSTSRIEGFAKRVKVHPGIIVGQLHHRDEIGYRILRQLLVPVRQVVIQVALTDGWKAELPPATS